MKLRIIYNILFIHFLINKNVFIFKCNLIQTSYCLEQISDNRVPPYGTQHTLQTSRNDTSPGLDDIPNRVLKILKLEGEVMDLLNHHSKALNIENTIPDDWRKSVIVPMPMKGNLPFNCYCFI